MQSAFICDDDDDHRWTDPKHWLNISDRQFSHTDEFPNVKLSE